MSTKLKIHPVRYRVNYTLKLEYLIISRGKSQNPLIPQITVQTIKKDILALLLLTPFSFLLSPFSYLLTTITIKSLALAMKKV